MLKTLKREENSSEYAVELSFSSEEPYDRGWYIEILDHADTAVALERLNSTGIVLFNHNWDAPIARLDDAKIAEGRGYARIAFDPRDAEAMRVYDMIDFGTLRGVSVGYRILDYEEVEPDAKSKDERFGGPCIVARKWEPHEISIVSVPADPTVGVGRSMDPETDLQRAWLETYARECIYNQNAYGGGLNV